MVSSRQPSLVYNTGHSDLANLEPCGSAAICDPHCDSAMTQQAYGELYALGMVGDFGTRSIG